MGIYVFSLMASLLRCPVHLHAALQTDASDDYSVQHERAYNRLFAGAQGGAVDDQRVVNVVMGRASNKAVDSMNHFCTLFKHSA